MVYQKDRSVAIGVGIQEPAPRPFAYAAPNGPWKTLEIIYYTAEHDARGFRSAVHVVVFTLDVYARRG